MGGKVDWHVARISYGKDSMKMLEVIRSRGLPLDQITTTDVWATDTIPANLPPVQEFKDRMDQWIWDQYRIEVDHLCARNKDGSKRTYEQMFYHVPKRKNSQSVQVERERERERGGSGPARSRDSQCWAAHGAKQCSRSESPPLGGYRGRSPDGPRTQGTTGARSSSIQVFDIKGWPLNRRTVRWCQDLKTKRLSGDNLSLVQKTQNFPMSALR